jgi:hypothetical protein
MCFVVIGRCISVIGWIARRKAMGLVGIPISASERNRPPVQMLGRSRPGRSGRERFRLARRLRRPTSRLRCCRQAFHLAGRSDGRDPTLPLPDHRAKRNLDVKSGILSMRFGDSTRIPQLFHKF